MYTQAHKRHFTKDALFAYTLLHTVHSSGHNKTSINVLNFIADSFYLFQEVVFDIVPNCDNSKFPNPTYKQLNHSSQNTSSALATEIDILQWVLYYKGY